MKRTMGFACNFQWDSKSEIPTFHGFCAWNSNFGLGSHIHVCIYIYYAYILSWIARVVFLARTLLCVRAEKEKKKKIDFSRFLRGKGMQKQKPACVRAEKDFFFFPFFARKRYAETKKNTRAFGQRKKKRKFFDFFPFFARKSSRNKKNTRAFEQRKKKRNFSICPVFRGEKICRKKVATHALGQRKEKKKKNRFFPFFAGKRSVETIKKWKESNKWSERNN